VLPQSSFSSIILALILHAGKTLENWSTFIFISIFALVFSYLQKRKLWVVLEPFGFLRFWTELQGVGSAEELWGFAQGLDFRPAEIRFRAGLLKRE
jgi:hypothetical protein